MIKQSRKLENKDIVRLENYWKKNPKAQLKDIQEPEKSQKSEAYVDIYSKKLGLPKVCPKIEANESCSFCTDKPTIFCAVFNSKVENYFTPAKYVAVFKTMIEKEADYDREVTLRRNTFIPSKGDDKGSSSYQCYSHLFIYSKLMIKIKQIFYLSRTKII